MNEHEIPNCNMTEPPLPPEGMRPKSRSQLRSWLIKTVLMLALIAVSIVLMFSIGNYVTGGEHERVNFIQFLKLLDYRRFALLLAVLLLYLAVESAKYAYLLKVSTGKFCWRVSIKTMFLGKYYDGITPSAWAGRPSRSYICTRRMFRAAWLPPSPSSATSSLPSSSPFFPSSFSS